MNRLTAARAFCSGLHSSIVHGFSFGDLVSFYSHTATLLRNLFMLLKERRENLLLKLIPNNISPRADQGRAHRSVQHRLLCVLHSPTGNQHLSLVSLGALASQGSFLLSAVSSSGSSAQSSPLGYALGPSQGLFPSWMI